MCGAKDDSAKEARKAERARAQRIDQGMVSIDESLAGFNDDYFNKQAGAYTDFYNPQLDDQYSDANERLTKSLATSGLLGSSVAADELGDLKKRYDTSRGEIASRGVDHANSLRGEVEGQRSTLVGQLRESANPGLAASQANVAKTRLETPRTFDGLADIFANSTAAVAQRAEANRAAGYDPGAGLWAPGNARRSSGYSVTMR